MDAPLNHSSSWSSRRTPRRECDIITFLRSCKLQPLESCCFALTGLPGVPSCPSRNARTVASTWLRWSSGERKGRKCSRLEHSLRPLPCLSLLVFFSPLLGPSKAYHFRLMFPCRHVPRVEGEARLVGWRDQSVRIRIYCFSFQRCKHRDVMNFFVLRLSDVSKGI